ncbi:hypothetical protein CALCODRAFT_225110 [Calocera cornea HHB12733]|uniref:Uncharacterized protein n=1 Tax=Calocera cornea HHB12733 TaxID=1353952 RepID=A0A165H6E3_9BASI|nr:hypothetical protein CALCODRAFT_225110 [Calocera cornea HHB12733]
MALLCYYYEGWIKRPNGWDENLGCIQTQYVGAYTSFKVQDVLISIATYVSLCLGTLVVETSPPVLDRAPVVFLNSMILVVVLCTVVPVARRQQNEVVTPLLDALVRDGVMYFAITTAAALLMVTMGVVYYNTPRAVSASEPWFLSVAPIAASRLFLNLRTTMAHRDGERGGLRPPESDSTVGTCGFSLPASTMTEGPEGGDGSQRAQEMLRQV